MPADDPPAGDRRASEGGISSATGAGEMPETPAQNKGRAPVVQGPLAVVISPRYALGEAAGRKSKGRPGDGAARDGMWLTRLVSDDYPMKSTWNSAKSTRSTSSSALMSPASIVSYSSVAGLL